jgi:hypothetical protein
MAKRTGLATMSVTELQRELKRRQRRVPALQRRRARFMAKVDAIDAQIAQLGGSSGGGTGRRGGGRRASGDSLVAHLKKALSGKTMGVSEVSDAVKKGGYQTSSPNFRTIVNAALINKKHGFKRVSRGQYTAV